MVKSRTLFLVLPLKTLFLKNSRSRLNLKLFLQFNVRRKRDLNPRHMEYDSIVLTAELFRL